MQARRLGRILTVTLGTASVATMAWLAPLAAQAPVSSTAAKKYTPPRTSWGHPDLQGMWNNGTSTPLERPSDLADREFLSDDEWAQRAKAVAGQAAVRPGDRNSDLALAYDNEWWDRGAPLKRTSLITDPSNGKLPPLTAEGQKAVAARAAAAKARGPADSWEDRPLQERCLVYHGVPPFPTGYNNNYLIAQTPNHVAIRYEMMAETRIIPLDGRPHLESRIPQWLGDARGRFDGDTLVVETTNYNPKTTFRFPVDHGTLKIVERFTRTAKDSIDYQFTVHNPSMYTRPWTAILPMVQAPGPIYEYACHEGNHGLANVLRGHRYEEAQERERGKSPQ